MLGYDLSYGSPAIHRRRATVQIYELDGPILPGDINFSRTSSAWSFGPSAVLLAHPADAPRFTYDPVTGGPLGLLLEGSATNLLPDTVANIATWDVSDATLTSLDLNALGTFPGVRVASVGNTWARMRSAFAAISGTSYAVTLFYRAGSAATLRLTVSGLTGGTRRFAGSPGILAPNGTASEVLTDLGQDILADGVTHRLQLRLDANITGSVQIGLGPQSGTVGDDVILLGAQVEQASTPTSMILSSGGALTRTADQPSFTELSGIFDLDIIYGDDTVEQQTSVSITPGIWPVLSQKTVKKIVVR
jgi:hypothetical protein